MPWLASTIDTELLAMMPIDLVLITFPSNFAADHFLDRRLKTKELEFPSALLCACFGSISVSVWNC